MINTLINSRVFAIAITAAFTTAFHSPAKANDERDTIPGKTSNKEIEIAHQFGFNYNKGTNGNSSNISSGKHMASGDVYVDFSWYKPESPLDINPYDKLRLDFSWYTPAQPLNINPYSE